MVIECTVGCLDSKSLGFRTCTRPLLAELNGCDGKAVVVSFFLFSMYEIEAPGGISARGQLLSTASERWN